MNKTIMFLGMLVVGFANAQQYDGKVGINTEKPSATLNVKSKVDNGKNLELENLSGTKLITVLDNGKIGFNNPSPKYRLDIVGYRDYSDNSIALRAYTETANAIGIDFFKARGTKENPLKLNQGDIIGGFNMLGYTGTKYIISSSISSQVTGEVTDDNLPTSIFFDITNLGVKRNRIMTLHHTNSVGIGSSHTPKAMLDIRAHNEMTTDVQKEKGKADVILISNLNKAPENPLTKERRYSISSSVYVPNAENYRSHSIDFGLIDSRTAARPFMAFGVAPAEGYPTDQDMTVEHMRIMHTGNIGMGTTAPENKLHIVATENPLKLEGLQAATGTSNQPLVVDANGVVKIGPAVASTGATQLFGTDGIECNKDNRGKMNFKTNDNGSDVFGICMRNKDGNYYWAYMVGGNNPTNGTGTFGDGLQ